MKSITLLILWVAGWSGALFAAPASIDPAFVPLRLYEGSWHVTRKNSPPGAQPDELTEQCSPIGKYFACQQSVNGAVSALLIVVAADKPGHYFTQSINLQGRALGKGDLDISADHWTFSSTWDQGGRMTYYKTIYVFSGRDRIHFEQQESTNGKDFSIKDSGDQMRVPPAH